MTQPPPDDMPSNGWLLVRERARLADTGVAAAATLLALLSLVPLYADLQWVAPAVAAVAVVALLGAGARAIALPVPFVPIIEAMGVIAVLTAVYTSDLAWAKVVPTTESWDALRPLITEGLLDAQAFSAPVPTLPGLVLLAVAGAGLAALCLDTFLASVRSPLLAGLPILVLFAGAAVLQFGQAPWWPFLAASTAWLLVLAADQRERVRAWAGLAGVTRIRGLSTGARRLGSAAIVVALVLGITLPTRPPAAPAGSGDGAGGGSAAEGGPVLLDPLVSMRRNLTLASDTEVLTYRTDAVEPSYFRVSVLEAFDGQTWRQRPGLESGRDPGWELPGVAQAPGGTATSAYDISVSNLQNAFLPLPYPMAALENVAGVEGGWRLDSGTGVAFSGDRAATGARYRVTALRPDVAAGDLRGATLAQGSLWPQLTLPGGMPAVVERTALEVTAGADNPYDRALALQDFFARSGGFEYSTTVRSGAGSDYLAEFLQDRVGYCEQFAGAMAVMARQLGIPSRIVVGFTQGAPVDDGVWSVTVRDAHAWPELWFEGIGWVRFEPTPAGSATVRTPAYAPLSSGGPGLSGDESRGVFDSEGFDAIAAPETTDVRGLVNRATLVVAILAGLLLLGWPMARRIVRRRRRLHARDYPAVVEGAWDEIGATAVDLGQPWSPYGTPRQVAERLSRGMPEPAAAALRRVRVQVEQVRYAAPVADSTTVRTAIMERSGAERAAAVRADVKTVVRELRRRVRWQARVAGYCWPSSERRRQRSSMRSMKPEDLRERGASAGAGVASSGARVPNAE